MKKIVKVLGTGCKKCNDLEKSVVKVSKEHNIDIDIEHVNDFVEIAKYQVMSTPALIVDEKIVSQGRLLKDSEILGFLK